MYMPQCVQINIKGVEGLSQAEDWNGWIKELLFRL